MATKVPQLNPIVGRAGRKPSSGKDRRLPRHMEKLRNPKLAPVLGVGFVTGLAEAAGVQVRELYASASIVADSIVQSRWSYPCLVGGAAIALATTSAGRKKIRSTLLWAIAKLEQKE
jgi:hypothetical protein